MACALSLAVPWWAGAGEPREAVDATGRGADLPSLEELEQAGYRIGEVRLEVGKIFDESKPEENNRLFRLANRLHLNTRPQVIRRLLLFSEGDPLSAARVAESERLLRRQGLFYDAVIRPTEVTNGTVDLQVETRDVWSLTAAVGLRRSGGVNTTRVEVSDSNLLGWGKQLQALYESNVDRDFAEIEYRDRNLAGRRVRLDLSIVWASDGTSYEVAVARPFYAFDTRWAVGFRSIDLSRDVALYDLGDVYDRIGLRERGGEAWIGWSAGRVGRRARRVMAGMTWSRFEFREPRTGTDPVFGALPTDRTLVYPWIGWESVADGYVVLRDLDKIERNEDLNLATHASLRLGHTIQRWSSSREEAVIQATYRNGRRVGKRQLWLFDAELEGRYGTGETRGLLGRVEVRDYIRNGRESRLLLALRYEFARRLDPELQLVVGGDRGLRGYPLRYQPGDRILLATLEQRWYNDREFFRLFRLGAAAFVDAARIWIDDAPVERRPFRVLRDIGVGLRISSSRSARAAMIHLDVAYPLDGPRDVDHLQWLVTTSETF